MSKSLHVYVALLRGINVGGKNTLPMEGLVTVMKSLGAIDVVTHLRTGNVIFKHAEKSPPELAKDISAAVANNYAFSPHTQVIPAEEFKKVISKNPYFGHEGNKVHILFMAREPSKALAASLLSIKSPEEEFEVHGKALYLHSPLGFSKSKIASKAEKHLVVEITARNMNTIDKIQTLL